MNALRDPAKAHGLDVNIYYLYGGGERDVRLAVVFGRQDGHASLVAVVDLVDNAVTQVVPAELW